MRENIIDVKESNKLTTIEVLKLIGENRNKMTEIRGLNDKIIKYFNKRNTPDKKQEVFEKVAATSMCVGAVAMPLIFNAVGAFPEVDNLGMMIVGAFPGAMAGVTLSPAVYGISEGVAKLMNYMREKKCARLEDEVTYNNNLIDENMGNDHVALENMDYVFDSEGDKDNDFAMEKE